MKKLITVPAPSLAIALALSLAAAAPAQANPSMAGDVTVNSNPFAILIGMLLPAIQKVR